MTGPGNYGWPFCTGTNTADEVYNEITFPSGPSGAKYDRANGPPDNSSRNTGLPTLPPAKPAGFRPRHLRTPNAKRRSDGRHRDLLSPQASHLSHRGMFGSGCVVASTCSEPT